MKYSVNERLVIGGRIYNGEISYKKAMEIYGLDESTVRTYERMYRETNNLPKKSYGLNHIEILKETDGPSYEEILAMTEKEKTDALILSEVERLRQKKGYRVEIVGGQKVFKWKDN